MVVMISGADPSITFLHLSLQQLSTLAVVSDFSCWNLTYFVKLTENYIGFFSEVSRGKLTCRSYLLFRGKRYNFEGS